MGGLAMPTFMVVLVSVCLVSTATETVARGSGVYGGSGAFEERENPSSAAEKSLSAKMCLRDSLAKRGAAAYEACTITAQMEIFADRLDRIEDKQLSEVAIISKHGSHVLEEEAEQHFLFETTTPQTAYAELVEAAEKFWGGKVANFVAEPSGALAVRARVQNNQQLSAALTTARRFGFLLELSCTFATLAPTLSPTLSPTVSPTESPSMQPTVMPTGSPSETPTPEPTSLGYCNKVQEKFGGTCSEVDGGYKLDAGNAKAADGSSVKSLFWKTDCKGYSLAFDDNNMTSADWSIVNICCLSFKGHGCPSSESAALFSRAASATTFGSNTMYHYNTQIRGESFDGNWEGGIVTKTCDASCSGCPGQDKDAEVRSITCVFN